MKRTIIVVFLGVFKVLYSMEPSSQETNIVRGTWAPRRMNDIKHNVIDDIIIKKAKQIEINTTIYSYDGRLLLAIACLGVPKSPYSLYQFKQFLMTAPLDVIKEGLQFKKHNITKATVKSAYFGRTATHYFDSIEVVGEKYENFDSGLCKFPVETQYYCAKHLIERHNNSRMLFLEPNEYSVLFRFLKAIE